MENKMYNFESYKDLEKLLKAEMKAARNMLSITKNKTYKDYYYMLTDIIRKYDDAPVEEIKKIKIDNLKEYALELSATKHGRFCTIGWAFRKESKAFRDAQEKFYRQQYLEDYKEKFKEIFEPGQTQLQK